MKELTIEAVRENLPKVQEFIGGMLERPDPDITLPARQRKRGGLGVYMVKQSMDRVSYEYRDGENILTIEKLLR